MAELLREPVTDPRTPQPVPPEQIPLLIGNARQAASDIRSIAEALARGSSGLQAEQAHQLARQAIRLGQVATALSGVQLSGVALLYIAPRLSFWKRLKACGQLCYQLLVKAS